MTVRAIPAQKGKKPAPAGPPSPPDLKPEKGITLRVLRWSVFVKSDSELWDKNTKKWEDLTGNKVITEYISWEDVRTKAENLLKQIKQPNTGF